MRYVNFCKKNIVDGKAKALVVNAGFANAFTGVKGKKINIISKRTIN